jgi:hypothetical protein
MEGLDYTPGQSRKGDMLKTFPEVPRPSAAAELIKVTGAVRLQFGSSLVPVAQAENLWTERFAKTM